MKFETKLNKLGINKEEVKNIIMNCECGEINGAYFIDLTKEKKEFIMEVVGNYLDDDSEEVDCWWDIKRIATFCKVFGISEEEIPKYYRLGFNEGGCDIAYELESNKDVLLVLTDDERYHNSFIQYSPSQQTEEETEENWVGFKIVSKADDRIYLAGQFDINSYDEDTDMGDWEYEQNDGKMASHIPAYWKVNGENLSFEYEQFIDSIDWEIFRQYLFDFADENKSIDMGTYFLYINEGAIVEIDIEEEVGFGVMHHIAKLTFKYNRQPIEFDKNILTDLRKELIFDEDGFNINDGWSSVRIIVPKFFDDEESIDEQDEIIQEWIEDVKQAFARQLSRDAGIYTDYGENIEQLVEEDIASDMKQMFSFSCAVNKNCVNDWMIENSYVEE